MSLTKNITLFNYMQGFLSVQIRHSHTYGVYLTVSLDSWGGYTERWQALAGREFFSPYGCNDRNWEVLVVEGVLIALHPFYQESVIALKLH